MTVEELYEQIGGNYGEALGRLANDALIERFVAKFPDDKSCENIVAAWQAGDEAAAFDAAHTAKGVCGNLALSKLAELASAITEALRPGNDDLRAIVDVDALVNELAQLHAETVGAIAAFASR